MSGDGKSGKIRKGLAEPAPHYHGHRERLRARFRDAGSNAVTDYELLELVLFRAIPQRDVKPLAKERSFANAAGWPATRRKRICWSGWISATPISTRWNTACIARTVFAAAACVFRSFTTTRTRGLSAAWRDMNEAAN